MPGGNTEIIQRAWDAFNEGDPSLWLDRYDPDVVLRVAPGGAVEPGTFVGAERVQRWFQELFDVFGRSYHVDIVDLTDVGDSVLCATKTRARGRQSGAEVEAPATSFLVTFRGGRIIRMDIPESLEEGRRLVGLS